MIMTGSIIKMYREGYLIYSPLSVIIDPADDGPEVEIIRRENQIEYDERLEQLKKKYDFN